MNQVEMDPQKPIDTIVANLIRGISERGRGFVLGLAKDTEGKEISIKVSEEVKPHDEWIPRAGLRAHVIESTESFIAYALLYGTPESSLVMFNDDGCTLTIDEAVERGKREVIRFPLDKSDPWEEFEAILEAPMGHKEMLRFLMAHESNLIEPAILKAMQSVRATATVNFESDIRDDGDTLGMIFKTSAGEELKKFPKLVGLSLPVLAMDDEEEFVEVHLRLEVRLPEQPQGQPSFTFYCSEWDRIAQLRIRQEGEKIRAGLPGWAVINGAYQVNEFPEK